MAKSKYRVIVTDKVERHYEIDAENPQSAAFAVATTTPEPIETKTVSTTVRTALVGGKADQLEASD